MATCQTNNQMRYMRRTMPDTSCPCHETVPMNGCPNTRDFFPCKYADCNGICSMAKMAEHL